MLYQYEFVKHTKLRELHFHFLYFIRKTRKIGKNKSFTPNLYFHPSFLNAAGQIAPKGTINKDIQNKFKLFFNDFKKLEQGLKDEFYSLVMFSVNLHLYFEDIDITEVMSLRGENIQRILKSDSFKNLMDSLWKYLKSPNAWEIDKHYGDFFDKLPKSKMCPFCGLNEISDQDLFKADYDHIAYKAAYPISSINIKNLAPACSDCNRNFKKAKDVFFNDDNTRRVFIYPYILKNKYKEQDIEIDLTGSIIPNTDLKTIDGKWEVNILPTTNFTQTWNEIYFIKDRYSLHIKHEKWLHELTAPLKIQNKNFADQNELKSYLSKYKEIFNPSNNLNTEYHLKYSYFKYLEVSINELLFNQINTMCA